jgi:hypothetical protein
MRDAEVGAAFDDLADAVGPAPVARDPRQPRLSAQRPLPSMMIATWAGPGPARSACNSNISNSTSGRIAGFRSA